MSKLSTEPAPQGSTLGIIGGGQLGRMFAQAARSLGYRIIVLEPQPDCPASEYADEHYSADYGDLESLEALSRHCIAASLEFESVPATAIEHLQNLIPVRPDASALNIAQSRIKEKAFAKRHAAQTPPTPHVAITELSQLEAAFDQLGPACILKTDSLGYDGKGQRPIEDVAQAQQAFTDFGSVPCVLEKKIELAQEISVIIARSADQMIAYQAVENEHRHGILHRSIIPARTSESLRTLARESTGAIAQALNYQGVLTVEYFVSDSGDLYFNEMAPRPHNSGHFSIDACHSSQFEQQARILCDMELGDPAQHTPAVMINLLGDLWQEGVAPDWTAIREEPTAHLHLYGKRDARPGRKMGHFCVLDADLDAAIERADQLYRQLLTRATPS